MSKCCLFIQLGLNAVRCLVISWCQPIDGLKGALGCSDQSRVQVPYQVYTVLQYCMPLDARLTDTVMYLVLKAHLEHPHRGICNYQKADDYLTSNVRVAKLVMETEQCTYNVVDLLRHPVHSDHLAVLTNAVGVTQPMHFAKSVEHIVHFCQGRYHSIIGKLRPGIGLLVGLLIHTLIGSILGLSNSISEPFCRTDDLTVDDLTVVDSSRSSGAAVARARHTNSPVAGIVRHSLAAEKAELRMARMMLAGHVVAGLAQVHRAAASFVWAELVVEAAGGALEVALP